MAVLVGLALGLLLYLCLTRWYGPPLALSRTFDVGFEWDSAHGFKSFAIGDNGLGERGGRVWQYLVAAQIKPRLGSYLKEVQCQHVRGSALTVVMNIVPIALPESWGRDGLDFEDLNRTPLMRAAEKGSADSIEKLLAAGADVNAKDYRGRTALLFALENENMTPSLTRELLAAGANVNVHDRDGYTPLLSAVKTVTGKDELEIVRELLAAHAETNAKNKAGETPLMASAANGDARMIKTLIAAGADPNVQDNTGATALAIAQQMHRTEVVQLLMQAGAR